VRAFEKAEKMLRAKFNIRALHRCHGAVTRFIAEGGKGPYPDIE